MFKTFDRYTLRARVFPVVVAAAPLFFAISAWIPFSQWPVKLAGGSAALIVAAFALAQLARDAGKKIEQPLWASWGGPPTARMLRYGDPSFDDGTRERIHRRLVTHGVVGQMPTKAEQAAAPDAADATYRMCSDWLRGKALEQKANSPFDVVHDENISYGFRRNILGIRVPALAIAVFSLAVVASAFVFDRSPVIELGAVVGIGAYVVLGVTEAALKRAADNYSERLLRAVEAIPAGKTPKTRSHYASR